MAKQALVLFTKLPLPGAVKTRLAPHLGGEVCVTLQWALLADLALVLRIVLDDLFVFYSPDNQPRELGRLQKLLGRKANYLPQQGSDLGQRMQTAFDLIFERGYDECLLMGSDIPLISGADIEAARELLSRHDVVLGPAEDGGYWLVGLKEPCASLFQGQSYGHSQVLAKALAVCTEQGLSVGLAATKRDVDTWDDLCHFHRAATPTDSPAFYGFLKNLFDEPD